MSNYTSSDLDKFEAAAKEAGGTIRPREREAGRIYLLADDAERSYAYVASKLFKSDGTNPTEARTGVYVRTYLEFVDKLDEAPSRGRKTNGTSAVTFKQTGNIVLDTNLNQREQMLAMQDQVRTRVNDATEAVEAFSAEDYIAETIEEFDAKIAELTEMREKWAANADDVATDSAKDVLDDLTKRRDEVTTASSDALTSLDKQLGLNTQMLKMLVTIDEDAAKSLKDAHEDLFTSLTEEEKPADAPVKAK